ncbi:serine hydrolase [Lacticaseibacillus zeae]|uniref:serine hydrolase n=1 Tax=Lacticaseibacillus zeae TaxID=57037 RepID=UPI0027961F74|nr:serine hydrolase [Lacticaseibacillus sp. NCIMB 15474]WLV86207.1 serine hydrolase [Lacticaseibacillus sp. NCIMB 15474]
MKHAHLVEQLNQLHRHFAEPHALLLADDHHLLYGAKTDTLFPAASLIKLGIAAYVKKRAEADPFQWNRMVELPATVGGAGVLRFMTASSWCVRDLVTLMLMVSDNLATNALLKLYGLPTISRWLAEHFPGTRLNRALMQSHADTDNWITAEAAWRLLRALLTPTHQSADGDWCAQALRHQQNRTKLLLAPTMRAFVGWTAGKSGELSNCEHDAACFAAEGEQLYAVVLTTYNHRREDAMRFNQQVGELIVDDFQQRRDRLL